MSDFIQWLGTPEARYVRHALALASFFLVLTLVRFVWTHRPSHVRYLRDYDRQVMEMVERERQQRSGSS
jgi:hypothetical protein